jgi:hypothetical protein
MLAIELSIRFSGDRPVGGYRAAAVLPYGTASFQVDVVVARNGYSLFCYKHYQCAYIL